MTTLETFLDTFRSAAVTEREKGTYFEELIVTYLRNEADYRDRYSDVWTYAEWADLVGLDKRDTGIDLVAKTRGTDEFHAIQLQDVCAGLQGSEERHRQLLHSIGQEAVHTPDHRRHDEPLE